MADNSKGYLTMMPDLESDMCRPCRCRERRVSCDVVVPLRKQLVLSNVERTESYLRDRRIPELIRFLMTKLIAVRPEKPNTYLEKLLDDCMLYRAQYGAAPVLYEDRHIEAVIKSFDPGDRGWMTAGQVRRAFITMGLNPIVTEEETIPTSVVFNQLKETQEKELLDLLRSGLDSEAV